MPTRVLMIDDAPQDRFLARRALDALFPDLAMAEVRDAAELAAALERRDFDAIVTDYRLKWSDGLKVLEAVRASGSDVPVVMFTHTGSEEIVAAGLRGGLADYIVKSPTQYRQLARSVRVALRNAEIARNEREARQREREALRTAEEALRLKDEFLATLSHELRTPLNAITGWLQVIQTHPSPERMQRGLAAIERNTGLLTRLIADLVDVSRIVSGTLTLQIEPTDIRKVVEAALDSVRPAMQAKRLRVEVLADPDPELVAADPDRLQQVVWNLLSNAVKFTPEGGRISIAARRREDRVELTVADTGTGIRSDFLPHVFDRFSQQDGRMTRHHGGMGLGLAIVRHLTEMHGGSVHVASIEGQGATFAVCIPMVCALDAPSEAPLASGPRAQLNGLRILLVDDDADAREVVTTMLTDQGAVVEVATSAAQGYESLRCGVPDVLMCDIGMPEEDGLAFMRRLRKHPDVRIAALPALAVTAYARSKDRQDALDAGFDAHLAKPLRSAELVAVVARLARPRASDGS